MVNAPQPEIAKPKRTTRDVLLSAFYVLIVLTGLLLCAVAFFLGFLFNALFILLLFLVCTVTVTRSWGVFRKTIEFRFIRRPFNREFRKYLFQCFNQWLFLVLVAIILKLAIIPMQFEPDDYWAIQIMVWGAVGFLMLLALIPPKIVRISTNSFFAMGWLFLAIELIRIFQPISRSEAVVLASPFRGESYIFQGGRSSLINHHYSVPGQRHALDIIKTKNGREGAVDETKLESYPSFGEKLHAPADGAVVKVINDRPDVQIGETDLEQIVGNHLVLDIGQGRFVLLAHLKKGSVRVKPGETVKSGEVVAECGNSGNTSGPHLHLQVQNQAEFEAGDLRTFPILFRDVTRVRLGKREPGKEMDVRRNDILLADEP